MDSHAKNTGLYVAIGILCVLVLLLGGYIVYDKVLTDKEIPVENNTNDSNNNHNNSNLISKLDSKKDWIYAADYSLPTNKESYYGFSDHSKLIRVKDLVVPYVNIDSSDAKKVNQEIYQLYEELIKKFNNNLKEEIWFTTVKYSTYTNNNIVSIVITTETAGTSTPIYEYYTYNFNLENGRLLSYNDVYEKLGYNTNNISEVVKEAVTNTMKEKYKENDFDNYNNQSIGNYTSSVSNNTIKYYIDNNNKLNIIVTLVIPAGQGNFDTVITLN